MGVIQGSNEIHESGSSTRPFSLLRHLMIINLMILKRMIYYFIRKTFLSGARFIQVTVIRLKDTETSIHIYSNKCIHFGVYVGIYQYL